MGNSVKTGKNESIKKLVMFLLVLYPLLGIYRLPIGIDIPLDSVAFLILFAITIGRKDRPIMKFPKGFTIYWIYISFVFLFLTDGFRISLLIPGGVSFCLWVIAFYVCLCYFDLDYFKKYYKAVFIFCSIVFFIQELSYYILGTRPIVFLPLPLTGSTPLDVIINNHVALDRSSCFFREPAHFAQFALPLLAIELMGPSQKNRLFSLFSIYIIFTIICMRSGNGFMGVIVLIAIRLWSFIKTSSLRTKLITIVVFIPILLSLSVLYLRTDQGAGIAERAADISADEGSSSFMRTFRGYFLYEDLPTINKVFGTTIEEVPKFISKSKVSYLFVSPITGEPDQYLNGIQTVLVTNGLIGLLLFLFIFIMLYCHNNILSKSLIVLFLSLLFIANLYLSQMMIISTVIPWLAQQKQSQIANRRTVSRYLGANVV